MKAVAPYVLLQLKIAMFTAVLEFHFIHWHFVHCLVTGYLVHSLGCSEHHVIFAMETTSMAHHSNIMCNVI